MVAPNTITLIDGRGNLLTVPAGADGAPYHIIEVGGDAVSPVNPLPIAVVKVWTYIAPDGALALAEANTAQNLQNANANTPSTVTIINPASSTSQGVDPAYAESIWVSPYTTAVVEGAGCVELVPGASITFGPTKQAISWVAATVGHKIQCIVQQ